MKKVIISAILLLAFTQIVYADDISIELNDEIVMFEEPPLIVKDRTMVPLKFLMDTLGYEVKWQASNSEVTATRGVNEIKLQIDNDILMINGKSIKSDVAPVIINDRTYVPLAVISRATGSEVTWISDTRTVVIKEKLDFLNLYYGKGAYKNYSALNGELNIVDQISYAWSRVEVINGTVLLNTTSVNNNEMFYPDGHELVMDLKNPKMLNIYADHDYELIFAQSDQLIQSIKKCILSPEINEPEFDGVVIDFENMSANNFEYYVEFLKALREEVPSIKIDVAVQPKAYTYSELLPFVDHIILMLHDYETKSEVIINFNQNYVNQPISPIEIIKRDLDEITKDIKPWYRDKLILQLNLSVVQWQGDSLYEVKRFTPGYQKLLDRMKLLSFSDFYFDQVSKNPYLQYVDEEDKINTIWYENEISLQEKINLVFEYDLGGISLWQIGNLPVTNETIEKDKYKINIWKTIKENNWSD